MYRTLKNYYYNHKKQEKKEDTEKFLNVVQKNYINYAPIFPALEKSKIDFSTEDMKKIITAFNNGKANFNTVKKICDLIMKENRISNDEVKNIKGQIIAETDLREDELDLSENFDETVKWFKSYLDYLKSAD